MFTVLSWLLGLVGSLVGTGAPAAAGNAELCVENAERRAESSSIGGRAWLAEIRTMAAAAAAFIEQHPRQDALVERHLASLKAKADEAFSPHAITLRKVELDIVDPDALARVPGLVVRAYRDLKFACMLGDFAPLRDVTWLRRHRENLARLLRHLPRMAEDELAAAAPVTDFRSPEFSSQLDALRVHAPGIAASGRNRADRSEP